MIQYKGGSGTSQEQAIIILGAENEFEGTDAEYHYIEGKVGYFEIETQTFLDEGDKKYDCLKVDGRTGKKT